MKKLFKISLLLVCIALLTACGNSSVDMIQDNLKKIELSSNLITYKAYYHNVIEYKKDKGNGIGHLFEKDRELFAEYTGTIDLGINLADVKITSNGSQIDVYIPKAKIIGEPKVDENDFKAENFIESSDGLNKNKITADDISEAMKESLSNMKETTKNNEELLVMAQNRAKAILEENIKQVVNLKETKYSINWELEK